MKKKKSVGKCIGLVFLWALSAATQIWAAEQFNFQHNSTPLISVSPALIVLDSAFRSHKSVSSVFQITVSSESQAWEIKVAVPWLRCSRYSGSGSAVLTVHAIPGALGSGQHKGRIKIIPLHSPHPPVYVDVKLRISTENKRKEPFGSFDSPGDGETVAGNIPVTGWALDDKGIDYVILYRDPVAGENNGGYVFISFPTFVKGARDDVAAAFPGYPNNDAAGWGYLMLTNMLPNQGNGRFVLHAAAVDTDSNWKKLGVRVIYGKNAESRLPFGAVDTPLQGGEASGSKFINYGWALTPQPNTIPINGSTFLLWIDGALHKQKARYNIYREDIASLFPEYANSKGAIAFFTINTEKFSDGVHTLAWTVWDDAGNMAGIGSRYFNVKNNTNASPEGAWNGINPETKAPTPDLGFLNARFRGKNPDQLREAISEFSAAAIRVIKGWAPSDDPEQEMSGYPEHERFCFPNSQGIIPLAIHPSERISIKLLEPGDRFIAAGRFSGSEWAPLPVGATLDSAAGTFFWHPGPVFRGEYHLIFFKKSGCGAIMRQETVITIAPEVPKSQNKESVYYQ